MTKTVLTIDDQADRRRLVRMTLEFDGCLVLEARDGEEGLQLARLHQPDLVLLDVMMSGRDGMAVSTAMHSDPVLRTIPVVMFTTSHPDGDLDADVEIGIKAHLNKPFGPVDLLQRIEQLMGQKTRN